MSDDDPTAQLPRQVRAGHSQIWSHTHYDRYADRDVRTVVEVDAWALDDPDRHAMVSIDTGTPAGIAVTLLSRPAAATLAEQLTAWASR